MRLFLAILTLSALFAKDIAAFSWEVWFYVNQQEIAREKCENKARPMMHCDGKCYLAKQLKKLEQKEQDHNSKTNPFRNVEKMQFFPVDFRFVMAVPVPEKRNPSCYGYRSLFSQENSGEIFHPPVVC